MKEMVGGCCVCSDDRGWSENPLVYCDGQSCTVAVHQACYGIVIVPTGPWYCRKCESQERSVKVKCELCPSKYGALKRTDNSGWAHVVCALYIPEVRFGNVTTMEPIQLQLIPPERFNKVCYICEEKGKPSNATVGACMQCNKAGCKQQFHVTCAQGLGLLCEEAGNYLDNVKYCGYCQHHYSKLKKGGNVKTIPPYKPVANETQSDSNSEKEPETGTSKNNISPQVAKKRSAVSAKPTPSKASNKSNNSQQKAVHNNKNSDKTKVSNNSSSGGSAIKSDKSAEVTSSVDQKLDKKDQKTSEVTVETPDKEVAKENKGGKKRKVNSRTPTPVSVSVTVCDNSAVVTPVTTTLTPAAPTSVTLSVDSKKTTAVSDINPDKVKKAKVEQTQSIVANQPVVALTSISTTKASSPSVVEPASTPEAATQSHVQASAQIQSQSLVVSVPLVNTALTDPHSIVGSGQVATVPNALMPERSSSVGSVTERMSVISSGGNSNQGLLSAEMNVGGLKMGYEKQADSINTEEDMELELEPSPSAIVEEPRMRSRAQSTEKTERPSRGKKRNSNGNNANNQQQNVPSTSVNNVTTQKRSSRSQHISPSPEPLGAFAAISQNQLKTSPPRTPSPESNNSTSRNSRSKGRKSAPANLAGGAAMKDTKDIKVFQNGLTAPHMLGNQLNPTSTMHSKMNEHLNSEMEAHSIFNANENNSNLVGPPLQHKIVQSTRASSTGSSTASGSSGLSSMLGGGGGGSIPQTLDQLLERQWEQGSQFLMEQAQHFDIASLLSCLHQLRAENMRLEEHVASLLQRRDHLLAVNARLAIPLTGQPAVSQPPTVNNIHPQVNVNEDLPRPHGSHVRASSTSRYSNQGPPDPALPSHEDVRSSHRSSSAGRYSGSSQHPPVDNGLPDGYPHSSQHSPTVRW